MRRRGVPDLASGGATAPLAPADLASEDPGRTEGMLLACFRASRDGIRERLVGLAL